MLRYENDLKGVKWIVIIEWYIVAVIILCGGIIFGVEKDRWLDAAKYAGVLLAVNSLNSQLMYWRAKQLLQDSASRKAFPLERYFAKAAADVVTPAQLSKTFKNGEDNVIERTLPTEADRALSSCSGGR